MLHRLILNATSTQLIDHIDRDKLNAQSINLRSASRSVNSHNRTKATLALSCFMGVSMQGKKFELRVKKDGIQHYGGLHKEEHVA